MKMRESEWCMLNAEKQVRIRREAEAASAFKRGTALLSSMLAEGNLVDKALEPLKLGYLEKIEYVAKNSVFIKSQDGHEGIQIVWAEAQVICIHRLLSKEFRNEFQALWLGVWNEHLDGRSKDQLVEAFKLKVEHREQHRREYGVTCEIQFAASPAVGVPSYELRH